MSLSRFPLILRSRGLSIPRLGDRFTSNSHGLPNNTVKQRCREFLLEVCVKQDVVAKQFETIIATHVVFEHLRAGLFVDADQTLNDNIVDFGPHQVRIDSLGREVLTQG